MGKKEHKSCKLNKKLAAVLEQNQWRITHSEKRDGEYEVEIENWTSFGQDVVQTISVRSMKDEDAIKEALYNLYECYDVSEEVKLYLEAKENGLRGVPDDVVTLVDDMREVERMLKKLHDDFCDYELNEKSPFRNMVRELSDKYSELRKASRDYVRDGVSVAIAILRKCEDNEIDFTERDFNTPALINGGVTDIISMCKDGTDAVLTYDDDEEHDIMLSKLEPSEIDTVIGCMMDAYDYLKENGK